MPFKMFHDLCPETAQAEMRTTTVVNRGSNPRLPDGEYHFLEMYCDERGCDCRRVFFYVVTSEGPGPVAVIAWGWETPEFYAKWMGDDKPAMINELIGPTLNLGSPQTDIAPGILEYVAAGLLQDNAYVERIKRHYFQFREKIDGTSDRLLQKKRIQKKLKKWKKRKK